MHVSGSTFANVAWAQTTKPLTANQVAHSEKTGDGSPAVKFDISEGSGKLSEAPDFRNMTPRAMMAWANEQHLAGNLTTNEFISLSSETLVMSRRSPAEFAAYLDTPMDHVAWGENQRGNLVAAGLQFDPKSGYAAWEGVLDLLRNL